VISTLGVWTKLEAVRGIGTGRPAEVGMLSAQRSRTAEAELQTAAVANHHRGNPRKVHHAVPACRTVAETDITAPADDRTARCPAMCGTRAGTPLTATVTGVEGTADRAALIPSISRGWMTGEANGVVADNRPENSIDAATRYPQERLEGPVMIAHHRCLHHRRHRRQCPGNNSCQRGLRLKPPRLQQQNAEGRRIFRQSRQRLGCSCRKTASVLSCLPHQWETHRLLAHHA